MKKNLLWGVVILVAVVLVVTILDGGSSPISTTQSTTKEGETNNTVTKSTTKTTTTSAPISGMKTSLGGIFNEKGSYQCDYESVTPSVRTSNVIYVSDGKMRGEFRTYETGLSKSTLVVYDGAYLYVWTEGMSVGKISQPKTLAELPGIIPEDVSSGKVLGSGLNNVSWSCHPWSKVSSLLVKPSYVTFTY